MGASGRERVVQYGWENIAAKVEDYYQFVIRRVAAHGPLPPHVSPNLATTTRELSPPIRDVTAVGPGPQSVAPNDDAVSRLQAKG